MRPGTQPKNIRPTLESQSESPQEISGYRLIRCRGRGGVADIWEAESPAGAREALKLVRLSARLHAGELRALELMRQVRHPSLLPVLGTWQVENLLVIRMELADRSLWDRFLEARSEGLRGIPRQELLGYFGPVAEAIDYLNDYRHACAGRQGVGIQHRDLKPQNIVLVRGQAKVADFGLARVMEQLVVSHTGPCTLPYAAPEYFRGRTSRASDQYALAVTYCQLRGGRVPFAGTTAQIAFGHLYNAPDLASLPDPERPIVARALAKTPEQRWPDCRSFVAALAALETSPTGPIPDCLPLPPEDNEADAEGEGEQDEEEGVASEDFLPLFGWTSGTADSKITPAAASGLEGLLDLLNARSHSTDALFVAWRDQFQSPSSNGPESPGSENESQSPALPAMREERPEPGPEGGAFGAQVPRRAGVRPNRPRSRSRIARAAAITMVVGLALLRPSIVTAPMPLGQRSPLPSRHTAAAQERESVAMAPAIAPIKPESEETGPPAVASPDPSTESIPETPIAATPARIAECVPKAAPSEAAFQLIAVPAQDEEPEPASESSAVSSHSTVSQPGAGNAAVARETTPAVPELIGPVASKSALPASPFAELRIEEPERTRALPISPSWGVPGSVGAPAIEEVYRAWGLVAPRDERGEAQRRSGASGRSVALSTGVIVPNAVFVIAGQSIRLRVRVPRDDTSLPLPLEFHKLPRGTSVDPATIAAGTDTGELVLSASEKAPTGRAEASLVCAGAGGWPRDEARFVVHVLPPSLTVIFERGRAALARGALEQAADAFTEVIRRNPGAFEARSYRGGIHERRGHYREALADYTVMIQLRPSQADSYLARARVHRELGENRLALADYTEALRIRADAGIYLARGSLHHEMGRYPAALADYDLALRLRPGDPAVHYRRGLTRCVQGENRGAIQDFSMVIQLDPKHADAYRYRADLFARMGQHARANADRNTFARLSAVSDQGLLK